MRHRISGCLVILAVAALPLASATADEAGLRQQAPAFEQIDANHDGMLSRSELPGSLRDLRMHFSQYAFVDHRISRATYEWYAAPGRRLREVRFAKPHGQYAFSHPYVPRQAPGATPPPPVHRR